MGLPEGIFRLIGITRRLDSLDWQLCLNQCHSSYMKSLWKF